MSRYEVDGVLGKGAAGVVYRARQVGVASRVVAFKRVAAGDEHDLERLKTEAQILAGLDHPHVIRIYDVVDDGDGIAIVMQYAAGGSLADRLGRVGRLAVGEVVATLAAIADALRSAHARDVLHGDIKPSNILFTADGHPLLSDFGAAMLAGSGSTSGTPEYRDPAVAAGGRYDQRSDVYSLAVVGFEMLSGSRPPPASDAEAGERALLELAPSTPGALARAVAGALHPDPARRTQDAGAFLAALHHAGRGLPTATPASTPVHLRAPDPGATPSEPAPARIEPPTPRFGRRPPPSTRPVAEPTAVLWRRVAAAAVGLALIPALLVAAVRHGAERPPAVAASAVAPRVPPSSTPAPLCPGARRPSRDGGWTLLAGDLHASGCRSWVRYRAGLLEVPAVGGHARRWHVGGPEDQVVLGDWDCNGTATVALYKADAGTVFVFDRWPAQDAALRSAASFDAGVLSGVARVVERAGCQAVEVVAALDA